MEKMRKLMEDKPRCSNPKKEMRGLKGEKRTDGREMATKVKLEENSSELKNQILVKIIEKYL